MSLLTFYSVKYLSRGAVKPYDCTSGSRIVLNSPVRSIRTTGRIFFDTLYLSKRWMTVSGAGLAVLG